MQLANTFARNRCYFCNPKARFSSHTLLARSTPVSLSTPDLLPPRTPDGLPFTSPERRGDFSKENEYPAPHAFL